MCPDIKKVCVTDRVPIASWHTCLHALNTNQATLLALRTMLHSYRLYVQPECAPHSAASVALTSGIFYPAGRFTCVDKQYGLQHVVCTRCTSALVPCKH
jgi:hypothetical protein